MRHGKEKDATYVGRWRRDLLADRLKEMCCRTRCICPKVMSNDFSNWCRDRYDGGVGEGWASKGF